MFSRGTASKESKRRHFPTRHERRFELVHFRNTGTDDTACIHSIQRRSCGYGGVRIKSRMAPSFGTCFRSLNRGTGGTSCGVDRARRARRAVHRPVEWRMAKSWNQDRDRGRFPLSERKTRRNQTSTTQHNAGPYSPSVRLGSPLGYHNDPTTLADVAPPSQPTLAQQG